MPVVLTAGQRVDSPQFEPVLEKVRVPRIGSGRPRVPPSRVRADKAYASRKNRAYLSRRGIRCTIPDKTDQALVDLRALGDAIHAGTCEPVVGELLVCGFEQASLAGGGARWHGNTAWGGYKQSGNGREWAGFGIGAYLESKSIVGVDT